MKKIILVLWVALFMSAGLAMANDTAGSLLPTGEIRFEKQDGVVLKHEALLLSDTVTVDYLFENITNSPIETTVFFPIPTVGPLHYYTEVPHDFKFRVWTDGKEIKPELSRKVTLDGTDVTKYFNLMGIDTYYKSINMDPEETSQTFEKIVEPLRKLPLEEQKKLEELGLLAKGCLMHEDQDPALWTADADCNKALADYDLAKKLTSDPDFFKRTGTKIPPYINPDRTYISPEMQVISHYYKCEDVLPRERKCKNNPDVYHLGPDAHDPWKTLEHYKQEVMYYWKQTFPPHKIVHIRHEYKPSWLGNGMYQPESHLVWEIVRKEIDEARRNGMTREEEEKSLVHWGKGASYIITTANNWKTPIGRFNLLVFGEEKAAVSADKVSYARISPKNYLLETKQDFVPAHEILFDLAGTTNIVPQFYRIDGPANVRVKPNGKKMSILKDGQYVWAYPADKKDWFVVLLDEETTGYTHRTNLIPFGK